MASNLRSRSIEFLISSSLELGASPIVKYSALTFFAERFLPALPEFVIGKGTEIWLLRSVEESNLQIFALVSIWISSKIHGPSPFSVKSLKSLGDVIINDQHFTTRDFVDAENVFLKVIDFGVGASSIAFVFLEDLLIQFRELSKLCDFISIQICMDIMDLLYETEEMSKFFKIPCMVAASVLVAAYVMSVPPQQWEFPMLPWVKFVASYEEADIREIVGSILHHVLEP